VTADVPGGCTAVASPARLTKLPRNLLGLSHSDLQLSSSETCNEDCNRDGVGPESGIGAQLWQALCAEGLKVMWRRTQSALRCGVAEVEKAVCRCPIRRRRDHGGATSPHVQTRRGRKHSISPSTKPEKTLPEENIIEIGGRLFQNAWRVVCSAAVPVRREALRRMARRVRHAALHRRPEPRCAAATAMARATRGEEG